MTEDTQSAGENAPAAAIIGDGEARVLALKGAWVTRSLNEAEAALAALDGEVKTLDLAGLTALDSAGAWLVHRTGLPVTGLAPRFQNLFETVARVEFREKLPDPQDHPFLRLAEDIGKGIVNAAITLGELISFLGLVLSRMAAMVREPHRLRMTAVVHQMEQVGLRAVPIVGLISVLIGSVLVNQGAIQLQRFGAEIFVVDMLVISHLRELGILLTAIIIAGRSGSAFTAQIGSMVLHEEVDAMQTIGLNPIDVLVIPRVIALVIMLPLLAFIADIVGLIGGALVAWASLDILPVVFAERARESMGLTTFLVGIIKAPFFAIVIAVCGCFAGLSVEKTAESVGANTTKSVVQSIFLVIVLDAAFAMFFTAVDW